MMKRSKTLLALLLCLSLLLSLQAAAFAAPEAAEPTAEPTSGPMTTAEQVAAKVTELCAECRAQGFTTEFEAAVWLHDWLTANADYDETLQQHEPEGVLLEGSGVCESYAKAYALLLDEMGIDNVFLSGEAGDPPEAHIWNVVKLDGVWCQIDVTWDDPKGGGAENHNYFGLTDTLMARDHFWDAADATQTCESLYNYYPQRMGALVYSTAEELEEQLHAAATAQQETIELVYIGDDASHEAIDDFLAWFKENAHIYGMAGFETSFTSYGCRISSISYREPWKFSETHLEEPIDAPAFTLNGPYGSYSRDMYSGNGLVVVFLTEYGEKYTTYVLDSLYDQVEALRDVGVEVLFCLDGCGTLGDYMYVNSSWPGLRYCYWQPSAVYAFYAALHPGATDYFWPLYAVVNGDSQIVYAADGSNFDADELLTEALAVGSANPLPEPAGAQAPAPDVENKNISSLSNNNGLKTPLSEACRDSAGGVFFVIDSAFTAGYTTTLLEEWESNFMLYESAGFSLVASIGEISNSEQAEYEHVSFLPYDSNDFWGLHGLVTGTTSGYMLSCCYLDSAGNILNYLNGGVLDPDDYLNAWISTMTYDAVLPAGLTTLEGYAFENTGLRTLDLSQASLSALPAYAFADCESLELVRIPVGVTVIDDFAFDNCPNLVIVCPFNTAASGYAWSKGIPMICQ